MAIKKSDVDKLKKYLILTDSQAEEAIDFVTELLELEIEDCEENYPHALKTLTDLRIARNRVVHWYHEVNNKEEEFDI
jgi:uncharacterized protein YutE (UPF0331/DUF86 family)